MRISIGTLEAAERERLAAADNETKYPHDIDCPWEKGGPCACGSEPLTTYKAHKEARRMDYVEMKKMLDDLMADTRPGYEETTLRLIIIKLLDTLQDRYDCDVRSLWREMTENQGAK